MRQQGKTPVSASWRRWSRRHPRQQGISPVFGPRAVQGARLGTIAVCASRGFPRCSATGLRRVVRLGAITIRASRGFPRCSASAPGGLHPGAETVRASNGFPRCSASAAKPLRPSAEIVCASNGFPRCLGQRAAQGPPPGLYSRMRQQWVSPVFGAVGHARRLTLDAHPRAPAGGFPGVPFSAQCTVRQPTGPPVASVGAANSPFLAPSPAA